MKPQKYWISSTHELLTGQTLLVEWLQIYKPATFNDPEEVENLSHHFYIDGFAVPEPEELTADILEQLETNAIYDREYED